MTLGGTLVTINALPINRGDLFTIIIGNTAATPSTVSGTFSNANSTKVGATTYQYQSGGAVINYGFDPNAWNNASTKNLTTFDSITGGNSVALYNVPEPSSLAMLVGSLGVTLGLQRFRRKTRGKYEL